VKKASAKDEMSPPPTAAGMLDLDKITRAWPLVLEEVRKSSRTLHALWGDANPVAFDTDTVTISFRYGFHAEKLLDPKSARVLGEAFASVLGSAPRVKATVAGVEEPDEVDDSREAEAAADPIDVLKSGFGDDLIEE
jgi:hypothetical protein